MPIESDCQLITALQRADTIRRACQHNVTGLEGKKLAHISDQRNDFMDHVRSRTLLALFAVYAQAQRCILWIAGKFRRGAPSWTRRNRKIRAAASESEWRCEDAFSAGTDSRAPRSILPG